MKTSQGVETLTLQPFSGIKKREVNKDDLVIVPDDQDMKEFFENQMDMIYTKLYKRIDHMIQTGKKEVYVFVYKNNAFGIKRSDVYSMLNKIIEHCIKEDIEKYELAAQARDLIKKIS